jgi:hypothetical protein
MTVLHRPAAPVRRAALLAACILAVLAGADVVLWRIATDRLRGAYLDWQGALAAQGWQLTASTPQAGGWPIAATLRLRDVRLAQTTAHGLVWTAARLRFGIWLAHPHEVAAIPSGQQSLALPGLPALAFTANRLRASFPLPAPVHAAQVVADRLTFATPSGPLVIAAAAIQADWRATSLHLTASADQAEMPPGRNWGLGQMVTGASIDLIAHGAWPAAPPGEAAGPWRTTGGTLDIARLAVHWGALDASGGGRAAIGADGQPQAALDLRVVEPQAALSALADAGAITRNAATAAGAVLALLEMPQRLTSQPAILNLPLRIDGGTVSIGQIPVARLPRIDW